LYGTHHIDSNTQTTDHKRQATDDKQHMAAIALMCEVIVEGNTREGEKRIIAWVNGHLWTFQRQPPEGYIIGSREFLFLLTSTRRLYRASVKLSLNTLEGLIVITQ